MWSPQALYSGLLAAHPVSSSGGRVFRCTHRAVSHCAPSSCKSLTSAELTLQDPKTTNSIAFGKSTSQRIYPKQHTVCESVIPIVRMREL